MNKRKDLNEKDEEVQEMISTMERKLAETETNLKDVDSIRDKIFELKRKSEIFREVLNKDSSSDYRNMC